MVTPPAFPISKSTVALASTTRLWLVSSTPENKYRPSLFTDIHTGSSAVNCTRTAAFGLGTGCGIKGAALAVSGTDVEAAGIGAGVDSGTAAGCTAAIAGADCSCAATGRRARDHQA
jgi:hypothetical protein